MSYNREIEKFVIQGYKNNLLNLITNDKHTFVLKDRRENFISLPPKDFKYHIFSGSLKSSQAFAYNVFSGVNELNLQFEFPMLVFDRDAQIDVMLENAQTQNVDLYEVKAFEINNIGMNKISKKRKIKYKIK